MSSNFSEASDFWCWVFNIYLSYSLWTWVFFKLEKYESKINWENQKNDFYNTIFMYFIFDVFLCIYVYFIHWSAGCWDFDSWDSLYS